MLINNLKIKILSLSSIQFFLLIGGQSVLADGGMLPNARVLYQPDGSVVVTYYVASSCREQESEKECMDRITAEGAYKDLPYDDLPIDQIPKDRSQRDKWRGAKGQGIWIDHSLTTKSEKIEELEKKLDEELEKENPDVSKVLKLQRQIEKAKEISHSVLTRDDLAQFEERQRSFVAAAIQAISDVFSGILNSIKEGFLALKNLVIGSPEKPSGITTYDHDTGKPYCLIVKSGKVESLPGTCDSLSSNPSNNSNQSNESNSTNQSEADTEPPVIQLNGLNPTEIEIGAVYSDQGAVVTDNVNHNLGYKVKLDDGPEIYPNELVLDTSTAGEHTITYIAADQASNIGTAARTVNIVDPNADSEPSSPSEPEPPTPPSEPTSPADGQPSGENPPQGEAPAT